MNKTVTDYITGQTLPDSGPEANRQLFEKILVDEKGYLKEDIKINEKIAVTFKGEEYVSSLDLVVFCNEKAFMAIKCVAGSLGSYEREILAGARLIYDYQIPFSISTNGKNALVRNAVTGKTYEKGHKGLDAVPSKKDAEKILDSIIFQKFPREKKEREMIIFRSYNIEKINKC
ncbi:MAG: type I restriction enzyme HsdR N-terminal domain-containing protein [Thermodesulfobacteriota bacterium]|nr:type I restriction enzyme HsdR N-terminal domain-containing protein [Thermodesulfobacteriota bacterium]